MAISVVDISEQLDEGTKIGSILCGERVTLGKSIADVKNDLKIREEILEKLENSDLTGFERPEFVAGYVRSYARYLKLDPKQVTDAFKEQCGLVTMDQNLSAKPKAKAKRPKAGAHSTGASLAVNSKSTFLTPKPRLDWFDRLKNGFHVVALLIPFVLVIGLIGAMVYGAVNAFGSLQKLEIVPTETRPVVATQNEMGAVGEQVEGVVSEAPAIDYEALYARQVLDTPIVTPRDGRIADIDPTSIGAFADQIPALEVQNLVVLEASEPANAPLVSIDPLIPSIELLPIGEVWVRIVNADDDKVYENLMKAGQAYSVPLQDESALILRAGNASELYVRINGDIYGPLGQDGAHVISGVVLTPEKLSEGYETVSEEMLKKLLEAEEAFLALAE